MKCWIASFPRSGNTFFRNILYEVYGIESSTWHKESQYPVEDNYADYTFVKTHLLPEDLIPNDPSIPAVYLVRDGRDAMVSIAHHRKDIVEPGTDFLQNLEEAIIAAEGSYFGGWSDNVNAWIERADIIIKYEDLVNDPRQQMERIEAIVDLPGADWRKLPSFDKQKYGSPKYGGQSTSEAVKVAPEEFSQRFFRKGQSGTWRQEMPDDLQRLFWQLHGDVLERLGYVTDGPQPQHHWLDGVAMQKLGFYNKEDNTTHKKYKVLIEGNKLQISKSDGVKRYLIQLLKGLDDISRRGSSIWHFDVLINRSIIPVSEYIHQIRSEIDDIQPYEKNLLRIKKMIKYVLPTRFYEPLSRFYRQSPARSMLRRIRQSALKKEVNNFVDQYKNSAEGYDLIHLPLPQHYDYLKGLNTKVVCTIHDMTHKILADYHTEENIRLSEEGVRFLSQSKAGIIAVSAHTKKDVIDHTDIPEKRVDIIPEYADSNLFYPVQNRDRLAHIQNKYNLTDSPYFLSLSTIEPRKNLVNTIRAFKLFKEKNRPSSVKLVIAGAMGWKPEAIRQELNNDSTDIVLAGFIEDKDLNVLYSNALAFCYLSTYEGFGLPPLEAMSCKKVVIHSGLTALPEVIGDTGLIADPHNIESICRQFEMVFKEKTLRAHLANRAYSRALQFSGRKSIMDTLKIYQKNISCE